MALNPKTAVAARNAALTQIVTILSTAGLMRWYDGTQATDPDTAIGSQIKAAELALSNPAGTVSNGTLTFSAITSAAAGNAVNPLTWFRFCSSTGTGAHDGSAGTSGCNLNVNSTNIGAGSTCACTSASITAPA